MSDGKIVFDTKIDTTGVKQGKKEITKELSGVSKIADNVKNTLKNAFKLKKKDTQIELTYAAQKPQSFFQDNIKDEQYAIESISKELDTAKAKLDSLYNVQSKYGNAPGLDEKIKQANAEILKYEQALNKSKQALADNQQWLQERIEIDATKQKIDELTAKKQKMDATGVNKSSQSYKNLVYDLNNAKSKLDVLQRGIDTTDVKVDELGNSFKSMADKASKSSIKLTNIFGKQVPKSINKTNNSLKYFGRMITSMLIMSAIFTLMRTFTEGMQGMAKVCPDVNSALSEMMSSLSYLKNSFLAAFSPLVSIVVPVVNTICNALAQLMNYISMLFSLLSGKSTYKVAIKQQKDYAASLDKTGSSASNAGKALASFDEINQLNISSSSGGSAGGDIDSGTFVDKELPTEQSAIAQKIKSIWDGIVQVFSNLGNAFKTAWDYAGNGQSILNSLANIINTILNGIQECVDATVIWSKNLNLIPLVSSIANLFKSLEPIIQTLTNLFVFLYTNAILPIATWALESALPAFIDVLSGALSVFNAVLQALQPLGQWLWDSFLQPIASWTGGIIVSVLEGIAKALKGISEWITQNKGLIETLAIVVGSLVAAWTLYYGVMNLIHTISMMVTAAQTALNAAFTLTTGPIGLIVMAIGALIAILVLLVKNWDTVKATASNCWNSIVDTFAGACAWFDTTVVQPLSDLFKGFVNGVLGFFETLANGAIGIFEDIVNFFVEAINSISFDIPWWLGGGHVGFNLSPITLDRVSLPRLATGTVVPPNAGEFAAILGDNKHETEVVSPLSTMKQALAEVLAEYGGGTINLEVNGSLAQLIRLLKIELAKEDKRKGKKLVVA